MSPLPHRLAATGIALALAVSAPALRAFAQSAPADSQGGGLILPGSISSTSGVVAPQSAAPQSAAPQSATPQSASPGTAQPAARAPAAAAPAPTPATAAPGAAAPQGAAKPKPTTPANPVGDWVVTPQVFSDGTFKACQAQTGFDNGLTLIFLALPVPKEVQEKQKLPPKVYNLVVGIPNANLPPSPEGPTLTLKLDGKMERVMKTAVAQSDAIMMGLDPKDDAFLKALTSASKLELSNPNDTALFSLKTWGKGFKDLNACVDQSVAGTMKLPNPPPMIPPGFAKLMIDAGLSNARPLPVDKMPPQARRGDYAWAIDNDVFGWLQRVPLPPNAPGIDKITQDYLDSLGKACAQGTFTPATGKAESLTQAEVMTANATCTLPQGAFYVDLILYKTKDASLYVVSHESKGESKAKAASTGAALLKVIRAEASKAEAPAPQAAPPGGNK